MKRHLPAFYIFIVLLGLTLVYAAIPHFTTEGYVVADDIAVDGTTITIAHGCKAIVADTSIERAYSIHTGLEGKIEGRPTTHDTFAQVLREFNLTLDGVQIKRFDGTYFYSDLILSNDDKILALDDQLV